MDTRFHSRDPRALQLQTLGIRLVMVSYCCIGALLDQWRRVALLGDSSAWLQNSLDLLPFALPANFLGLCCLVLFARRGVADPPISTLTEPLEVLLGSRPVTNRLALFLCAAAWVLGLAL